MSKYVLAKSLTIVFGGITILIFLLLRFGNFIGLVGLVGSIEMAITILVISALLFAISSIFYIWQKAHHDLPAHQKTEILEAYAEHTSKESYGKSQSDISIIKSKESK